MPIASIGDVLTKAVAFLQARHIPEARLSAQLLLSDVLKVNRIDLYIQFEKLLSENQIDLYRSYIRRRAQHEPIAYILGSQPFFGLSLKVTPDVLIPRAETEELVELVLKVLKDRGPMRGLDLCTGSGAIALALKSQRSDWDIKAADICSKALEIATHNADLSNLSVKFILSDLTDQIDGAFDFVVCNPPYIQEGIIETLERSVKSFEPHKALSGGESGLEFYKRLAIELPRILTPGAKVFLEIGHDQKEAVLALFSAPLFFKAECLQDLSRKDRFIIVEYKLGPRM